MRRPGRGGAGRLPRRGLRCESGVPNRIGRSYLTCLGCGGHGAVVLLNLSAVWQGVEPFGERKDFDTRFFLGALQLQDELHGCLRLESLGIVFEAWAESAVSPFHFDEPVDAAVQRDHEIDFALLFVAQVKEFPTFAEGVFPEIVPRQVVYESVISGSVGLAQLTTAGSRV